MTTHESKSGDPTACFPGDPAKAGVTPIKGGTKFSTVPLNWKEAYYTNRPLMSASNVDQELGWTREEFKKIGVKYAFRRMRRVVILLSMLFGAFLTPAIAQLSIGIGLPNLSIGINVPLYPEFERVPGYPVYYAPQVNSNYFFYDGMYWVFQSDNWYASSWYNGPWAMVSPIAVPVFMLRIPVRYYRHPPMYFHGWQQDAPPRWGDHWGNDWQHQRSGWDQWNPNSVPTPAPLPTYQRQYSGNRYPSYEQQRTINSQNYRYRPHDPVVQQHYRQYAVPNAPAPSRQRQQQQKQPQQQQQRQQPQQQRQQPQQQRQQPQQQRQQPQQQRQQPQQQRQQPQHQQQPQPSGQSHGSQGQGKDHSGDKG